MASLAVAPSDILNVRCQRTEDPWRLPAPIAVVGSVPEVAPS